MNAEEFYEEFKGALEYLGLRWGDKHLAAVLLLGDIITLSYGRRTATIALPKKEGAA